MMKFSGSKEQLLATLTTLKSLRLNSSMALFIEVFGTDKDMGEKLWNTYVARYSSDWIAFWGYLDEAHKDVLLNYLTTKEEKK
jgi:hypothetical protein